MSRERMEFCGKNSGLLCIVASDMRLNVLRFEHCSTGPDGMAMENRRRNLVSGIEVHIM